MVHFISLIFLTFSMILGLMEGAGNEMGVSLHVYGCKYVFLFRFLFFFLLVQKKTLMIILQWSVFLEYNT